MPNLPRISASKLEIPFKWFITALPTLSACRPSLTELKITNTFFEDMMLVFRSVKNVCLQKLQIGQNQNWHLNLLLICEITIDMRNNCGKCDEKYF